MTANLTTKTGFVVIGASSGYTVVAGQSPLKRLNYFDGKFLRAPDLKLEQQALLNQVRLSNQAGGAGVVYGYDCTLDGGDLLSISGGLAIDGLGRLLQMADSLSIGVGELIEKSRLADQALLQTGGKTTAAVFDDCQLYAKGDSGELAEANDLYLITVCHAEALCGEEDVYGKLCESACVGDTQRPYIIEGVSLRAVPLNLTVPLIQSGAVSLSTKHLRSRVASAYFEQERRQPASHISREGLNSGIWCLGAEMNDPLCVPLAVVSRSGASTQFLDAWTARRERMEAPPRRYWAALMAMRPWPVFLAQVLQFQCQLSRCLAQEAPPGDEGPCADEKALARKAAEDLERLMKRYQQIAEQLAQQEEQGFKPTLKQELQPFALADIRHTYDRLIDISLVQLPSRLLINRCGIVELPSAGYLPVLNSDTLTINQQVRRMLGEGVDLRFCVVRPDFVPHALEEAQHMQRISLLQGLDDPLNKPKVDILVPDGRIEAVEPEVEGSGYEMELRAGGDTLLSDFGRQVSVATPMDVTNMQSVAAKSSLDAADLYTRSTFNLKKVIAARATLQVTGDSTTTSEAEDKVLRGAARGEKLESGGYAFHYAGRMPLLVRMLLANLTKAQILQQAGDSTLATANATGGSTLTLLGSADEQKTADKLSSDAKMRAAMIENQTDRLTSGLRINAAADASPIYDMWLSMRTEQDPFALPRGGITSISAELVLMVSTLMRDAETTLVVEATQNGSLKVEDILSAGSEPRRRCSINSNGMLNTITQVGEERKVDTKPLRFTEQLYISWENEAGVHPGFKLQVPELSAFDAWDTDNIDIDIGFEFTRKWVSAEEMNLEGLVTYLMRYVTGNQSVTAENDVPLFSGVQRINPEVLKPDNILHDTSLTALREIGNGLHSSSFAANNALLLFPPLKPVPSELLVYGTHDWVLFHRRRDKQCEHDEIPPVRVRPLRYRLYHVGSLKSKGDLEIFRKGLLENNGPIISRYHPLASSIVEYEAGLSTVRTSHTSLRNDWQALVHDADASLILGAIGSSGIAFDEGPIMAKLRLESIGEVLAPVTPLDEEAELLTLPKVPDVLAEGAVDGVIVLAVVAAEVATTCHQVYRVAVDDKLLPAFQEQLQSDYQAALKAFEGQLLEHTPLFLDQTDQFASADQATQLTTAWQATGGGLPEQLFVVRQVDAAGNPSIDQPFTKQGQRLVSALQGPDQINTSLVSTPTALTPCPGISIIVPAPVADAYIRTFAYKASTPLVPTEFIASLNEEIQKTGFWEWLGSPNISEIPLGIVRYDENNQADSTNLSNIKDTAGAEGLLDPDNDFQLFATVVSRNGSTAADQERDRKQADQIRQTLTTNPMTALVNSSTTWNENDATAAVLIIAVQAFIIGVLGVVTDATEWTTTNPEDLVTGFKKEIQVDDSGNVVKDAAFESAVKSMVENGDVVSNIEVVGVTATAAKAELQKAKAILKEMQAAGVAAADATITARAAKATERQTIEAMGAGIKAGMIMTK